jgi:hypothetical protein
LYYTCQDLLEARAVTAEPGAVRVVTEESLNPVVNIIWDLELEVLVEHSTVTHTIKCLGKIQSIDNDEQVCVEECCNCVE